MDAKIWVPLLGLALTMAVGFWKIAQGQARMELKLDLMWDAYIKGRVDVFAGGRRRTDPPADDR